MDGQVRLWTPPVDAVQASALYLDRSRVWAARVATRRYGDQWGDLAAVTFSAVTPEDAYDFLARQLGEQLLT